MAGNEIYIGKMLERLYGVVDKIDASTQAQIDALHDTAAILNNILANTGITQQQTAFTGTNLSAVTIKSNIPYYTAKYILGYREHSGTSTPPGTGAIFWNDSGDIRLLLKTSNSNLESECEMLIDLTGKNAMTFSFHTPNANMREKLDISINETVVYSYDSDVLTAESQSVDVSGYSGECRIKFKATQKNTAYSTAYCYLRLLSIDGIRLLENNSTLSYSGNKIVSSGGTLARGLCKYTVSDAAQWSTLKFIGNLDGVRMWIVDNDGNIIMPLAATTNMSDLSLFDFYIFYEISKPDAYISSVIFRYF